MKLYFSPTSPFSRKVRIVAALLGFDDKIELIGTDTGNPQDVIRVKNPLGKIPTLERDDGVCLYDSAVICAYLDDLAGGGRVIPKEREARFAALTLEALGDGIADASILQIYEKRMRAESEYSANWVAHQRDKVERALVALESDLPAQPKPEVDVGAIALACALGYLDLRFEGFWRADHPRLVAWLDAFAAAVPAYTGTKA
ncbi:glutathione S-transferase [Rhodoblastus acidophilus]|uniref:Glutathione S-transferase n=1 Tax=Candidatus Rhodoblastus alkanivorans TaxID=2954117 RepID=A0ABS9Z5F7_9HYPH|nr:glutathione S-transferase [Candidatus Rhodoblastus alkanivorans]MCI4677643.1 glutathione S-transferase [Candidatus Rhodoblastus alkanivorans]MCI4682625.1 glutathione S-transferase [Candidatus Rhodoblastus alkanivorans]MDI4639931.1 glutathione S-transferase [Rhodoblastus acidophilus]